MRKSLKEELSAQAEKKDMYKIHYTFEEKGLEPKTIDNAEPGFSILEIALKNKIDISHNCGGVCACSTCHVYIEKGENFVEELSDKKADEFHTKLDKLVHDYIGHSSDEKKEKAALKKGFFNLNFK